MIGSQRHSISLAIIKITNPAREMHKRFRAKRTLDWVQNAVSERCRRSCAQWAKCSSAVAYHYRIKLVYHVVRKIYQLIIQLFLQLRELFL